MTTPTTPKLTSDPPVSSIRIVRQCEWAMNTDHRCQAEARWTSHIATIGGEWCDAHRYPKDVLLPNDKLSHGGETTR